MTVSWPKYMFVFVGICLFSITVGALSVYFQPHKDLSNSNADYIFTPKSFNDAIVQNETSHSKQYIDKVIQIEGKPSRIIPSANSSILVYETENFEITALMDPTVVVKQEQILDDFKISCFCAGVEHSDGLFPGIIQLNRCVIK